MTGKAIVKDFARSDSPAVQRQLDRLAALSVPQGRLGLETIRALLGRLGDPHLRLPPVFHVAGTNGKGSTCAFLRAMLEADGKRVHVTTSPHLVRYNERIRVAGELISDARLAELLAEVLDIGADLAPSFFEVTVAAAFAEFARVPADACVIEVGLGGRYDATNAIERPVACGITALGIDHERFLLSPEEGTPTEPIARIAFEKAGILKSGVPFATLDQASEAAAAIRAQAVRVGAPMFQPWHCEGTEEGFDYRSPLGTFSALPLPALEGEHQIENAGLAIAMLQASPFEIGEEAIRAGLREARWPARLQRLGPGPLSGSRAVWLDGGHNPGAAYRLLGYFAPDVLRNGAAVHLILGMIEGKNSAGFIEILRDIARSITIVPVPGHDWIPAEEFGDGCASAESVPAALAALPSDDLPVLVTGSLYLAGEVLRLNDEVPD